MFNKQQFSEDLSRLRHKKELSRKQVANEAGVHYGSIQGIENQDYEPRSGTFLKLCKWMETEPINYLKL